MNITRVTDASGKLTFIEIEATAVGLRSLAGALRRLHGVSGLRVHNGWPLTRDDVIHFTFGGQEFLVDTPFTEFCLHPISAECPPELFEQVASHLEQSRVGWLQRLI